MNLDDWVALIKTTLGPGEFKLVAVEFLREFYRGATIQYTDGTGDAGVDAWVIFSTEPRVRAAAQFYAGNGSWEAKLTEDVETIDAYRSNLASDDPERQDLAQLKFVCTHAPSRTKVEEVRGQLMRERGVSVDILDARAIASQALERRGHLLSLLAASIPGFARGDRSPPTARDQLLLSFAFFHEDPAKYRLEVAKSAIATILHRAPEGLRREKLLLDSAGLLGLSQPSRLLERAIRNLEREQKIVNDGSRITATVELAERATTALKLAAVDEAKLRGDCEAALEILLPKGTHHRDARARRAVASVFNELGFLIRNSVADRALGVNREGSRKAEDAARRRWRALERTLADELDLDGPGIHAAFKSLVQVAARSAFASSLAAAELFVQLTEYDSSELAAALETSSPLRVVLDASIAMPMICALYDGPAVEWETSVAAHALHQSLTARGARIVVPSVYIEEIAAHLLNARAFATIVETEAELERSKNFFVAHFCSTHALGVARTTARFNEFLADFGASPSSSVKWQRKDLRTAEAELKEIFARYGIGVAEIDLQRDDVALVDEPERDQVVLLHDRAVVRWLTGGDGRGSLLCTADRWLQGVLEDFDEIALDSAALADLLELVRPTGSHRGLVTPLAIAQSLTDETRTLAASIWDKLVDFEGDLTDRRKVARAREFLAWFLSQPRTSSNLIDDWLAFRDALSPPR